jgi:hypothetical protein
MTAQYDVTNEAGFSRILPTTDLFQSDRSLGSQATTLVVGEYFVSASQATAHSEVNYLSSPIEEIRDRLNRWFVELGSKTKLQCEDSILYVAPISRISPDFFDDYEPFFKAIFLYRASFGGPVEEGLTPPSDAQMSAAYLGLANLMASFAPAPSPMLLEDGTIGGFWRRGRCYASIDFEADGEHTWVETDGQEYKSGTWTLPGEPVPSALLQELLSLAS